LLLSGGTEGADFKLLAFAWGREKGFHHVLANSVCERRGEVERKRRSDAGKALTSDEREAFRQRVSNKRPRTETRTTNGSKNGISGPGSTKRVSASSVGRGKQISSSSPSGLATKKASPSPPGPATKKASASSFVSPSTNKTGDSVNTALV
jgi:hypothetical protein